MDIRETKINLMNSNPYEGRIKWQHSKRTASKLIITIFVLSTLLAIAVTAVCIILFYNRQHQEDKRVSSTTEFRQQTANSDEELRSLRNRVEALETQMSDCPCQTRNGDAVWSVHDGMWFELNSRMKREVNAMRVELNESDHILNNHHGLASSNIALLYADPKALENAANSSVISPTSNTFFRESTKYQFDYCGRTMQNRIGGGDFWCTPRNSRSKDLYMVNNNNRFFPYFAEAPWMSDNRSRENFIVTGDLGHERRYIRVLNPGIYIVVSSAHFTHLNNRTNNIRYGVYYRDINHRTPTLISHCLFSVNSESEKGSVTPCPTWQLVPLKQGDEVYMQFSGFNWMRIEKQSFFLALIKLNDYTF